MTENDIRDFFFKTKELYSLIAGEKELNIDGLRIDIFAVDDCGNPFIIEFKRGKNRHIVGQSAHYLAVIQSKHKEIELRLKYFNINWQNIKVICIAQSFNKRDIDALTFEPIKDRVFLYTFSIVKDYREKSIFALQLSSVNGSRTSPLKLPPVETHNVNFHEHVKKIASIQGKERQRQYYADTVLPILDLVKQSLREKFEERALYPHISYFQSGPHIRFRLGLNKTHSHRASIEVSFFKTGVESGFDLTHCVPDAQALKSAYIESPDEMVQSLSKLRDYELFIPNVGITEICAIANFNDKGLNMFLSNYDPKKNRDCYFILLRPCVKDLLSQEDLLNLFEQEYSAFKFLIEKIQKIRS